LGNVCVFDIDYINIGSTVTVHARGAVGVQEGKDIMSPAEEDRLRTMEDVIEANNIS
jgi:hypothetical protein